MWLGGWRGVDIVVALHCALFWVFVGCQRLDLFPVSPPAASHRLARFPTPDNPNPVADVSFGRHPTFDVDCNVESREDCSTLPFLWECCWSALLRR